MPTVDHEVTVLACAALHSSDLGGAERSHVERTLDLRAERVVTHSLLPEPDGGLGHMLREEGLPVTMHPGAPWWISTRTHGEGEPLQPLRDLVSDQAVHGYLESLVKIRPDVVITVSSVNPHAALAARALGIPHVWFLTELAVFGHGLFPTVPHLEVGQAILALANQVVCVSSAVRDQFFGPVTEQEADDRGIHIIHDSPRLHLPHAIGAQGQPSERETRVGVIGALAPSKGQAVAVAALGVLVRRGVRVRMTLFGKGTAAAVTEIRALAAEWGVEDLLEIRHESEQSAVYSDIDIVAVTAVDEGFGRVPFEAASARRPIVYAQQGALEEFMVPGVTGIAFEPGDEGSLAESIERLIDSPELRQRLAETAQRHLADFCAVPPRAPAVRAVLQRAMSTIDACPWDGAVSTIRYESWHKLGAERDGLAVERDGLAVERDGLAVERDGLAVERDWWFAQFHQLRLRRAVRVALVLAGVLGRIRRRQ